MDRANFAENVLTRHHFYTEKSRISRLSRTRSGQERNG